MPWSFGGAPFLLRRMVEIVTNSIIPVVGIPIDRIGERLRIREIRYHSDTTGTDG
jgi:hypothetical protein